MTPERWRQIQTLFNAALREDRAGRDGFLDQACGDDRTLAAEVRRFLARHDQADRDKFLAAPSGVRTEIGQTVVTPESSRLGQRVGAYQIDRLIGRGGMGSVYLAHRVDDFAQDVALKVITPGPDADELVRRFRTERQVLANLQHPHMARLLDGGTTDDGLPYFVMEYLESEPLDRYRESRKVSLADQPRLLRTACLAVQHAHEKGVIHRDLKLGNILVTADGTAKVVDFGLARRTEEDPDHPATQGFVGTPSYSAPEQADLAFSPDSRRLASSGGDPITLGRPGDVRVWDVDSRRQTAALEGRRIRSGTWRSALTGNAWPAGAWTGRPRSGTCKRAGWRCRWRNTLNRSPPSPTPPTVRAW